LRFDGPRFLSRPLGVHWAGWETDTYRLQRSGWDLAVEHQVGRDEYCLLMRHEQMSLYAYTDVITIERVMQDPSFHAERYPIFQVRRMAKMLYSNWTDMSLNFAAFQQIDATPQFSERRMQSVEDFNIFALARSKAEEVLVNRADMTVIEHLEAIKALQEPRQHEIRQRMLRERSNQIPVRSTPKFQLVAQLIHVENAA
jgi:hypothetical protein